MFANFYFPAAGSFVILTISTQALSPRINDLCFRSLHGCYSPESLEYSCKF